MARCYAPPVPGPQNTTLAMAPSGPMNPRAPPPPHGAVYRPAHVPQACPGGQRTSPPSRLQTPKGSPRRGMWLQI